MRPQDILVPTSQGLCCRPGDFHIDPVRPVRRALITHAHSDHARPGHEAVLATRETLDMMRLRYGEGFATSTQEIRCGETVSLGTTRVTFHPAGHVLGSAQIAVECGPLRIVASGDYKDRPDPTCAAFELVPCDIFITEATFGLPVFRHGDAEGEVRKLLHSVALFPERAHIVGAYSLGKAQRVIALAREAGHDAPIYLHGAMETLTRYYESRGIDLGEVRLARGTPKAELAGTITIAPPSAITDVWTRRFPDPLACFASGWMRVRARARQHGVELPLVISDHADWDGLLATIKATGAGEIWVTHGQEDALVHWCETQGLKARPLALVGYGDEDEDLDAGLEAEAVKAEVQGELGSSSLAPRSGPSIPSPQSIPDVSGIDHSSDAEVGQARLRVGEGQGGGSDERSDSRSPPSRIATRSDLPLKGGGEEKKARRKSRASDEGEA